MVAGILTVYFTTPKKLGMLFKYFIIMSSKTKGIEIENERKFEFNYMKPNLSKLIKEI